MLPIPQFESRWYKAGRGMFPNTVVPWNSSASTSELKKKKKKSSCICLKNRMNCQTHRLKWKHSQVGPKWVINIRSFTIGPFFKNNLTHYNIRYTYWCPPPPKKTRQTNKQGTADFSPFCKCKYQSKKQVAELFYSLNIYLNHWPINQLSEFYSAKCLNQALAS